MIKIEIHQAEHGKDLWTVEQHDITEVSWEDFRLNLRSMF